MEKGGATREKSCKIFPLSSDRPPSTEKNSHVARLFSLSLSPKPPRTSFLLLHQADDIRSKNAENPVIVYSKTYCPYCTEVKSLFTKLNVPAKVVEIDTLADADAVSAALADVAGRRTVPQVFIGGEHVGGCDDTVAANKSGKLKELLGGVGVKV